MVVECDIEVLFRDVSVTTGCRRSWYFKFLQSYKLPQLTTTAAGAVGMDNVFRRLRQEDARSDLITVNQSIKWPLDF